MQSEKEKDKGFYSFRADANALGGLLEKPFRKPIPTLAPVSLPAVGGFAMARSEAFTLDNIVSCSSAHTRVSGQEDDDGSISILVTAVVEGVNLLEVVEAERIVAQLSILIPADRKHVRVSTAGSRFEGLRLAGRPVDPRLSQRLQDRESERDEQGRAQGATAGHLWEIGKEQAARVTNAFAGSHNAAWAENRFKWMQTDTMTNTSTLCSLVHGFVSPDRPEHCGHVVEIPGFGRFFFGELLLTRNSAQLVSIRAELGCPVTGQVTINCAGGGGVGNDD
jgi:hypothetical protein